MPAYVGLPNTHSVGLVPGYHGGPISAWRTTRSMPTAIRIRTAIRFPTYAPSGWTGRLQGRRTLLASFDRTRHTSMRPGSWRPDRFDQQAFTMVLGDAARRPSTFARRIPGSATATAGTSGARALLARRLVQAGVRFVTLTFGGWDFHSSLERGMKSVLPILDAAVGSLIEDLSERGLLDSTMVLVMGEFGRTPRMNKTGVPGSDPVPGRDHWGNVMSVLAAGGGFARGRVVGSSNSRGETPQGPAGAAPGPAGHDLPPARSRSGDHVPQPFRPAGHDRFQRRGDHASCSPDRPAIPPHPPLPRPRLISAAGEPR